MHDWGECPWFSIEDTITLLQDDFIFHGSSPMFLIDLRWYKSIQEDNYGFNNLAIKQYNELIPLFIDYRNSSQNCPAFNQVNGTDLENLCKKAYVISYKINVTDNIELLEDLLDVIRKIIRLIGQAMPQTANSLADYCEGVAVLRNCQKELEKANFGSFRGLFGRGMQYVSMVKVK